MWHDGERIYSINHRLATNIFVCILFFICGCSGSGGITGVVCDGNDLGAISGAGIVIVGGDDPWRGTTTGATGQFLFPDVPGGTYRMIAFQPGYHREIVFDVRVGSDSVSVVSFRMVNEALHVEPNPIQWIATDSTILPMKQFTQSGKLFYLKCR